MVSTGGGVLKKTAGKNANPFYYIEEIPAPIIASKASIIPPERREIVLYDIPTKTGKVYTLIAQ